MFMHVRSVITKVLDHSFLPSPLTDARASHNPANERVLSGKEGKDLIMLKQEILQKFITIVGRERCKSSPEDLLTYGYDACIYEYLPDAVVFPKSTQEAAEIMKAASAHNVFVTPRGAGSVWARKPWRNGGSSCAFP